MARPKITPKAFEKWLHGSKKKRQGDPYLQSTIERYVQQCKPLFRLPKEKLEDKDQLFYIIQKTINTSKSQTFFSAVQHWLEWWGWSDQEIKRLRAPPVRAHARNSKRFLQSKVLSKGQMTRMFNEAYSPMMTLALRMLYDTACRRTEVCNIKFGDIHFRSKYNPKHADDLKEGIHASIHIIGKGGKGRTVYLHEKTVNLMRELHAKEPWSKDDPVILFRNIKTGAPIKIQHQYLYNKVVSEGQRILGRHVYTHMFRHTAASHMADNGADILDIAAALGHESMVTTKIYIEISSYRSHQAFKLYSEEL